MHSLVKVFSVIHSTDRNEKLRRYDLKRYNNCYCNANIERAFIPTEDWEEWLADIDENLDKQDDR